MDYTIIRNAILAAEWRTPFELTSISDEDCKNIVIIDLSKNSADSIPELQGQTNEFLTWHVFMYLWLRDTQIRTSEELKDILLADQQNITIIEVNKHLGIPIPELQGMTLPVLLSHAYRWSLERDLRPMTNALNNVVSPAAKRFSTHDNEGNSMDTLKVMQDGQTLLGIYHTYHGNVFNLSVAEASLTSPTSWTKIASLGAHAHQGNLRKMGNGYLLVNEQDVPDNGNNIQVRYYESLQKLKDNEASHDISLARKFSSCAEGTPNIIAITGTSPSDCGIFIGFHYYQDCEVDRQAYGVLKNLNASQWTAWKNEVVNTNLSQMDYYGNFGGRYQFGWNGKKLEIIEANLVTGDDDIKWRSWHCLVGMNGFFVPLSQITPNNSVSFANPFVTELDNGNYLSGAFLPSQGSGANESGQLIYEFAQP